MGSRTEDGQHLGEGRDRGEALNMDSVNRGEAGHRGRVDQQFEGPLGTGQL